MSYILEALKKSEYARHQGKVPDLTTVPVTAAPARHGAPALHVAYAMVAAVLTVLVAVLLVWRPWQSPQADALAAAPVPPHASPQQPALEPSVAQTVPAAGAERSGLPVLSARAAERDTPTSDAGQPVAPPATSSPQAAPAASIAQAQPASPPSPATSARPAPIRAETPVVEQATPPAHPARPPSPPDRILAFYELPESIRAALPALAVSGFSYTDEPRARMAVVNDRILREGEHAGGGVTLERIASDGIVLRYQGFRFRP